MMTRDRIRELVGQSLWLLVVGVCFLLLVVVVLNVFDAYDDNTAERTDADELTTSTASDVRPKTLRATTTSTLPTTTAAPATSSTSATFTEDTDPWLRLADCESGEWRADDTIVPGSARWNIRDSVHEGGLQFAVQTWDDYKLPGYPDNAGDATPQQQITVAIRVRDGVPGTSDPYLNAQGWAAWPECSRKVGLR